MTKQDDTQWPELNFNEIQDTLETLHQWIQIVGKIRFKTMPWQNHSWHTVLYITSHGYSTQSIPYDGRIFQIDFDFEQHKLFIQCSDEKTTSIDLKPMTVADFYSEIFQKLKSIGILVEINGKPNEMEVAIPFKENIVNKYYNPEAANTIWKAMLKANAVFTKFRNEFIGKSSPVHLFWGAFDLAVTRFSGNSAPLYQTQIPNMPLEVMQEAYSQEVSSAGFWPGSKGSPIPVFYSYTYPNNARFGAQKAIPKEAFYSTDMGEFILKYEDVQKSNNPEETLYQFLKSTYLAATETSDWDRKKLERPSI